MQIFKNNGIALLATGLGAGLAVTTLQACDDGDGGGLLGDLAEQCGLSCPSRGILQGNAQISGIASIDAFFGAVIDVQSSASTVSANVRAELDAIAVSLGLEPGAASADIAASIRGRLDAAVNGGLTIDYQPAQCSASVEVSAKAAAECDVEADPGSLEVKCEGSCQVEASAEASCEGDATLVCEFTPPDLQCSGSCQGTCQLELAAECSGTCRGTCEGECSVRNTAGDCAGECRGECQGECELAAGGSCSGSCEGTCTVRGPEGGCEANATVKCEASANASVECNGRCEGKAEPPSVRAECEATVEAKANASIECTPPSLQIGFQWSAELEGDLEGQASFRAWLEGFRGHYAALIAASAKAEFVLEAGQGLISAAGNVVGDVAGELQGSADLKASVGAGCAVGQLRDVGTALQSAVGSLQFSVEAFAEISAVFGR